MALSRRCKNVIKGDNCIKSTCIIWRHLLKTKMDGSQTNSFGFSQRCIFRLLQISVRIPGDQHYFTMNSKGVM